MTIKFVERPQAPRRFRPPNVEESAILETLKNGKAAAIPLDGKLSPNSTQNRLRLWFNARDYKFHYRITPDHKNILCWIEQRKVRK